MSRPLDHGRLSRRAAILSALAGIVVATLPAHAFEGAQFEAKSFEEMQAAGKPILIEVHAGWCPVCWKQTPVVTELLKKPDLAGFARITVEYDLEKDVLKRFAVQKQSTLVVFKGKTETGRSVGVTDPAAIEKLLRTAL